MKDLTKGYPAKVIILFAIPMIFGSIFQQLYNLVDSKIVSNFVGTEAFAAVGATGVISNTIINFLNSLTLGFAIPIANSFGGKNFKRMRRAIAGTIILTLTGAVVLMIAMLLVIPSLLRLLATPEDIMAPALSYVRIILYGLLFASLYNMCANVLRAVGDSRTPLYCLIIAVIVNVGLDLLFVKVFEMGIDGAAWATIVSQALCAGLCLGYILLKFRDILPKRGEWKLEMREYGELLSSGLAMGFMSLVVNFGTITLQGAINSLGTAIVAAHTAARKVFDIFTVSLYCVGNAMTTYVSQNMGAGHPSRIRQGVRHAICICSGITIVLIAVCYVFGRSIFTWLASTDDTAIIDAAVMYTRISIVFFFVLGPLFVFRCSLQGMGRKVIPVCSSLVEMVIKVLSAMLLVPRFEYVGVAFTEPVSWICMTILLAAAYFARPPEKLIAELPQ